MKNVKKNVELHYCIVDERGFLVDKKQHFSTFIDAVKFARGINDNRPNGFRFSKPIIKT